MTTQVPAVSAIDVGPGEPQQRAQDRPVEQRILRRRLRRRKRAFFLVDRNFGERNIGHFRSIRLFRREVFGVKLPQRLNGGIERAVGKFRELQRDLEQRDHVGLRSDQDATPVQGADGGIGLVQAELPLQPIAPPPCKPGRSSRPPPGWDGRCRSTPARRAPIRASERLQIGAGQPLGLQLLDRGAHGVVELQDLPAARSRSLIALPIGSSRNVSTRRRID